MLRFEPTVQQDSSGGLGASLLTEEKIEDGKFFRFSSWRLGRLLATNNGSGAGSGPASDGGWASHGTVADAGTHVKGGGGAVLRARNERTGKEGGAMLFGAGGGPGGVGVGCWNPSEFAAPGDFEVGDVLVLLDSADAAEPPSARGEAGRCRLTLSNPS